MPICSPKQWSIQLGIETFFSNCLRNKASHRGRVVELIEMHGNVQVLDMRHAFRHHKSWVVFRDFCWNSLNF